MSDGVRVRGVASGTAGGLAVTPATLLTVLGAEVWKGLLVLWSHPAAIILQVGTSLVLYLGIQFAIGQGQLPRDLLPATLVAMAGYIFLFIASLVTVGDLVEEMRTGTLEQAHLSPVRSSVLVFGRLGSAAIQGAIVAVVSVAVPVLLLRVALPLRWEAALPLVLTFVNGLAFTLLFAGVSLRAPFIGELHHVATGVIAVFSGMFVPIALFPGWLQKIANLVPMSLGVQTTLKVLLQHRSLGDVWADRSLGVLVGYTIALAVFGWLVFVASERRALRDGTLAL